MDERTAHLRQRRQEILRNHAEWKREERVHSKAIDRVIGIPLLILSGAVLIGAVIHLWPK